MTDIPAETHRHGEPVSPSSATPHSHEAAATSTPPVDPDPALDSSGASVNPVGAGVPPADHAHQTDQADQAAAADTPESHAGGLAGPAAWAAELAGLRDQIAGFHERSAAQEDVIRRMQQRIEELQAEVARSFFAPVINELASLHADATQAAEAAEATAETFTAQRAHNELLAFLARVETCMEHLGVEPLAARPLDDFDSRTQTAVGTTPTADPRLDRRVARVVRQGFAPPGARRPTVYTRVVVYTHDPEHAPASAPEPAPALDGTPDMPPTIPLPDRSNER